MFSPLSISSEPHLLHLEEFSNPCLLGHLHIQDIRILFSNKNKFFTCKQNLGLYNTWENMRCLHSKSPDIAIVVYPAEN